MKYIVETFRTAGLEAQWIKTNTGKPVIVARKPNAPEWYVVDRSMFEDMEKEGVGSAFERHTLLGDIFSLPVRTLNSKSKSMKTKTESVFTREQYDGLAGEQKQAVEAVAEYLTGEGLADGAALSTEEIAGTFNLLKASHGCVPIEEAGEELDQTIRRKFGALFQVGMELAEAELAKQGKKQREDFNFCMVVDPSYEDATHVATVDYDKPICHLHEWHKAWHVGFTSLSELADEVLCIRTGLSNRCPSPKS